MPDCTHEHLHSETTQRQITEFIPASWERDYADQTHETRTVTDVAWICDDCGDCVEVEIGD